MIGRRQQLQRQTVTPTVQNQEYEVEFNVDRATHWIQRLKVMNLTDGDHTNLSLRIQAEGEVIYNGAFCTLTELFRKTDAVGAATAETSPRLLTFDQPITINKNYPLIISIKDSKATPDGVYSFILEGVAAPVEGAPTG